MRSHHCSRKRSWEPLPLTRHAQRRAQQRAIQRGAIEAALAWGRRYRQRGGRVAFHLGRRAVEAAAREGVDVSAHEGTAVVLAPDGAIVTVVRTHDTRRMRKG